MIALGGFLVFIWAMSRLLYARDVRDDGLVGRNARLQVQIGWAALVAGAPILLIGLAFAVLG